MTALIVAVSLLAVVTLLNLFVLLGVIRRLRTMAASDHDARPELLPTVGAPVGAFSITSTGGVAVTEADLASGQSVVLLLSPSCLPCQGTATRLANSSADLPERTFVLLRTEPGDPDLDSMLDTLRDIDLRGKATIGTFDGTAGVEDAFGSRGYPTAMRVQDGVVVAASYQYADVLPDRITA